MHPLVDFKVRVADGGEERYFDDNSDACHVRYQQGLATPEVKTARRKGWGLAGAKGWGRGSENVVPERRLLHLTHLHPVLRKIVKRTSFTYRSVANLGMGGNRFTASDSTVRVVHIN